MIAAVQCIKLPFVVAKFSEEPLNNFPRSNIEYVKEIGKGWFGQVVRLIFLCHATFLLVHESMFFKYVFLYILGDRG